MFCSYLFLIRKIGKEFYEISEPSRLVFRHQIYCCDQIFRPGKIKSFTRRQLHSITLLEFQSLDLLLFNLKHFYFYLKYCKVASGRLSWLVAHPSIFRLFMKGKFDAFVLWPLAKIVQNWIVDRSTARDFKVSVLGG